MAEQGKASTEPGLDARVPASERNTLDIGRMRDEFLDIASRDENPEFDTAMGEIGHVKFKDGDRDAHFTGNSLSGKLEISGTQNYTTMDFQPTTVDYQNIQKNGNFQAGKLRLNSPQTSFEVSNQSLDTPTVPVPKSDYYDATTSASEMLQEIPAGSESEVFRKVFLDGTASMTDVRADFLHQISSGAGNCGLSAEQQKELQDLCASPNAGTPRKLSLALGKLSQADPENKKLRELREKAGLWQSLEDFPKLKADGIVRKSQYYISPAQLQMQAAARGWDLDPKSGLPIADTIIVGGGPGGLSTAYQLSERGTRTVVFEGGHVGQGFSDAGAQSVHQLRTNGAASNLIYTANGNQLGVDVSMQRQLGKTREKCDEAREKWSAASKEEMHGVSQARADETQFPANRSELFEHMSQVAEGLVEHYPDTLVTEASPVSTIEKVPGADGQPALYKVTTDQGHQMMARSLVMATGFVGGDGEHARSLQMFQHLEDAPNSGVTVLPNDNDLFTDNDKINKNLLVFSERLVGRPEVRARIKSLPEGSRIAVIGGGESATKGALEALHLNPGVSLDLYTSGALVPYQTQIPTSVIAPAVGEAAIRYPEVAEKTIESLKDFGTPVTSETLQELLELESAGRVRIHEMGERFDQKSIAVEAGDKALKFTVKDPQVAANLIAQRAEWKSAGLYGDQPPTDDPSVLPQANMVMIAAGYDKKSLQAGPLLKQLEAQGVIEFDHGNLQYGADGLTSAKDPMVAFNTAGAVAMASDTAIPGRAIRAYRLAQNFGAKLPAREKPADRVASGLAYGSAKTDSTSENFNWTKEHALEFIDDKGVDPQSVANRQAFVDTIQDPAERASAQHRLDASVRFPGPNAPLAALMVRALEVPDSLSPAEKFMWERAQLVS